MENYIVTLKYPGKIELPENPEQAFSDAQNIILAFFNQFTIITVSELQVSERTTPADYSADLYEQCTVLEVKIRLTEQELLDEAAIFKRIFQDLTNGKFIVERIDEHSEGDIVQSLLTFSEKERFHHYLVNFKVEGQLENLATQKDEDIITEVLMLLQAGDVALLAYEVTHDLEIDNHCDSDSSKITENHTIFEIRLVINEFNVDFNDIETLYYYVLSQLTHCESAVTYKYNCGYEPYIKSVVGIDIHCNIQSLEFDDVEDLFEGF